MGMRIYTIRSWNSENYYRVVVTTMTEETEIEFCKLTGASQFFRNGECFSQWN
jgi:hypothetical protein